MTAREASEEDIFSTDVTAPSTLTASHSHPATASVAHNSNTAAQARATGATAPNGGLGGGARSITDLQQAEASARYHSSNGAPLDGAISSTSSLSGSSSEGEDTRRRDRLYDGAGEVPTPPRGEGVSVSSAHLATPQRAGQQRVGGSGQQNHHHHHHLLGGYDVEGVEIALPNTPSRGSENSPAQVSGNHLPHYSSRAHMSSAGSGRNARPPAETTSEPNPLNSPERNEIELQSVAAANHRMDGVGIGRPPTGPQRGGGGGGAAAPASVVDDEGNYTYNHTNAQQQQQLPPPAHSSGMSEANASATALHHRYPPPLAPTTHQQQQNATDASVATARTPTAPSPSPAGAGGIGVRQGGQAAAPAAPPTALAEAQEERRRVAAAAVERALAGGASHQEAIAAGIAAASVITVATSAPPPQPATPQQHAFDADTASVPASGAHDGMTSASTQMVGAGGVWAGGAGAAAVTLQQQQQQQQQMASTSALPATAAAAGTGGGAPGAAQQPQLTTDRNGRQRVPNSAIAARPRVQCTQSLKTRQAVLLDSEWMLSHPHCAPSQCLAPRNLFGARCLIVDSCGKYYDDEEDCCRGLVVDHPHLFGALLCAADVATVGCPGGCFYHGMGTAFAGCWARWMVRRRYRVEGFGWQDLLMAMCCVSCFTAQIRYERDHNMLYSLGGGGGGLHGPPSADVEMR